MYAALASSIQDGRDSSALRENTHVTGSVSRSSFVTTTSGGHDLKAKRWVKEDIVAMQDAETSDAMNAMRSSGASRGRGTKVPPAFRMPRMATYSSGLCGIRIGIV